MARRLRGAGIVPKLNRRS